MKCEQYEELFTGWINKELSKSEQQELEQHLAGCNACSAELEAIRQVWVEMGELNVPEPSANLRVKFHAMLDTYKEAEAEKTGFITGIKEQLTSLWNWQPRVNLAYQALIIILSFGCGYWFFNTGKSGQQEQQLKELSSQVVDLKQTMMLAMLENPSASERMRAVSYTSEIKQADQQVIDALLTTLNNDDNVNVRLSTLDALAEMAGHAEVREGLIRSITEQESPLMQSAIADVMLKLQEKRSVKSFRELLKQKGLDKGVREKINKTISNLT